MFEHFIAAQDPIYEQALVELKQGRKRSHWMWFVFPQIRGLGHSAMSDRFALAGNEEAALYLNHPILGSRLRAATQSVLRHQESRTAHEIFGTPDDLKFRSCMTLFAHAAPEDLLFEQALRAFYEGKEDRETTRLL